MNQPFSVASEVVTQMGKHPQLRDRAIEIIFNPMTYGLSDGSKIKEVHRITGLIKGILSSPEKLSYSQVQEPSQSPESWWVKIAAHLPGLSRQVALAPHKNLIIRPKNPGFYDEGTLRGMKFLILKLVESIGEDDIELSGRLLDVYMTLRQWEIAAAKARGGRWTGYFYQKVEDLVHIQGLLPKLLQLTAEVEDDEERSDAYFSLYKAYAESNRVEEALNILSKVTLGSHGGGPNIFSKTSGNQKNRNATLKEIRRLGGALEVQRLVVVGDAASAQGEPKEAKALYEEAWKKSANNDPKDLDASYRQFKRDIVDYFIDVARRTGTTFEEKGELELLEIVRQKALTELNGYNRNTRYDHWIMSFADRVIFELTRSGFYEKAEEIVQLKDKKARIEYWGAAQAQRMRPEERDKGYKQMAIAAAHRKDYLKISEYLGKMVEYKPDAMLQITGIFGSMGDFENSFVTSALNALQIVNNGGISRDKDDIGMSTRVLFIDKGESLYVLGKAMLDRGFDIEKVKLVLIKAASVGLGHQTLNDLIQVIRGHQELRPILVPVLGAAFKENGSIISHEQHVAILDTLREFFPDLISTDPTSRIQNPQSGARLALRRDPSGLAQGGAGLVPSESETSRGTRLADVAEWWPFQEGDRTVYVLGVHHGSPSALGLMQERLIPLLKEDASDWLFVKEDAGEASTFKENVLFSDLASEYGIPVAKAITRKYAVESVKKTIQIGLEGGFFTKDDFYAALMEDIFPIQITQGMPPSASVSIPAIQQLANDFNLKESYLHKRLAYNARMLLTHGQAYREHVSIVINLLLEVGNDISREKMIQMLDRYPTKRKIFVLMGIQHLSVFPLGARLAEDGVADRMVSFLKELDATKVSEGLAARLNFSAAPIRSAIEAKAKISFFPADQTAGPSYGIKEDFFKGYASRMETLSVDEQGIVANGFMAIAQLSNEDPEIAKSKLDEVSRIIVGMRRQLQTPSGARLADTKQGTKDAGRRTPALNLVPSALSNLFAGRVAYAQAANIGVNDIQNIALLLDDHSLQVMGLKWHDSGRQVLEVINPGSTTPVLIPIADLKVTPEGLEAKVSTLDTKTIVMGKDQAVVRDLDGLLEELKDKTAVLDIDPSIFKNPFMLEQFFLEYASKRNLPVLKNSRIRLLGGDSIASRQAREILNGLKLSFVLTTTAPEGAGVAELTTPDRYKPSQRDALKNYVFLNTTKDGAYTFFMEYLVTAARIDLSQELDDRFIQATKTLTGLDQVDRTELKDSLEGLADPDVLLKYAIRAIVPLDFNTALQFTKNMLRALGQAA